MGNGEVGEEGLKGAGGELWAHASSQGPFVLPTWKEGVAVCLTLSTGAGDALAEVRAPLGGQPWPLGALGARGSLPG